MARLLLVEDDPDQLELRRLILEHAGHRVWTAASRQEALQAFGEAQPAIVVMDLRLPRTEDGLRLIGELRQCCSAVPIVVLSGAEENFERSAARVLVDHYLKKPVPTEELINLIGKLACDSMSG